MAEAQQAPLPNVDPPQPAAPAAPAAADLAPQPKKPKGKPAPVQPAKRKGIIEIPENAFKARVQREAAVLIRQQTGLPMEKIVELVKAGGVRQGGNGKSTAQATADSALRQENERLKKERDRLKRESEDRVRKAERQARKASDRATTAEMKAEARVAGIKDPDYAVHLLVRAVLADENIEPAKFFEGLKKTHPILFENPPPPPAPVPIPASSAPPESPALGEVRPAPAAPGAPPADVNAEKMDDQAFARHQRSYGYVPGM